MGALETISIQMGKSVSIKEGLKTLRVHVVNVFLMFRL